MYDAHALAVTTIVTVSRWYRLDADLPDLPPYVMGYIWWAWNDANDPERY